jgi:signal transduction histidine kinase
VEPVSLPDVTREAVELARTASSSNGAAPPVDVEAPAPVMVRGSPEGLRRLVTNLVENAIKYTRPGGTVAISAEEDPERENIGISVEDTGVGIAPEDQVRIFEQMFQASNDSRESRRGLGLGLYICRELVTQMGGRIRVDSEPGRGSRFTFTLPLLSAASVQETRRSA